MKKTVEMYGQMVEVEVVKPSRRRVASSIQKPRYNATSQRGAKHMAREAGQYVECEEE